MSAADCCIPQRSSGPRQRFRDRRAQPRPTTTIPIVFVTGTDSVASSLVASLSRPGGNLTGIANLTVELGPKRLQLLRELIPNAAVFGVLVDPRFPSQSTIAGLQAAARTLGLQLVRAERFVSEEVRDRLLESRSQQ
jgi:putative ABC transport system substrate-binding protein